MGLATQFGRRVQQLRKTAGLSQDQLGQRAGANGKVVGEIERGVRNPTLETVERLLKALGAEPYEAFGFNLFKQPRAGRELDEETILSLLRRNDKSLRPLLVQLVGDVLSWAATRKK